MRSLLTVEVLWMIFRCNKKEKRKMKRKHIETQPQKKEEYEFYKKIIKEKKEAKEEKLKKIEEKKEEKKNHANQLFAKAQRNINYNILKAKGLTRKRKKCDRNPRIKLRRKYEKAVKLRRVISYIIIQKTVKEYRGKVDSYAGENNGISSRTIKSTSIK